MTVDDFLERLEGVKSSVAGHVAICPAHQDNEASLGITEGDDGRILLKCYAGCETKDIVEALGLGMRDLFPTNSRRDVEPEAVYQYTNEEGKILFESVRFPGKRFTQRHYDPEHPDARADGYVYDLEGVRRVLYRLSDVLNAVTLNKTIYVMEGEKDVDRFVQVTGHTATCNPMGAGKWRPEYTELLRGAKVTMIQDRDDPGRRHAKTVMDALHGVAQATRLLQPKVGKDVSDHFDAGLTIHELVIPRSTPRRGITTAAQMYEQALDYLNYRESDLPGYQLLPGVEGSTVRPGRVYAGGAYTGDGKTTLALQGFRGIASLGVPCGYFSMEMSETDLRNRLIAHKGVPLWMLERPWTLKDDKARLELYHFAAEEMREWRYEIVYDTQLNADKIRKETIDREYEFVVVDHIHRFGRKGREQFEEEILKITNLALDINIPVLILCQLRRFQRGPNMIAYPPPTLQDFRETEMLGSEASIAFAIWRQRDTDGLRYIGNKSEFRVLKNRHTTTRRDQAGHIEMLNFDLQTSLYSLESAITESPQVETTPPVWR